MPATSVTTAPLSELHVRPIERHEEPRYKELMAQHHYLGDLAKIGETLWYVAIWRDQWVALPKASGGSNQLSIRCLKGGDWNRAIYRD